MGTVDEILALNQGITEMEKNLAVQASQLISAERSIKKIESSLNAVRSDLVITQNNYNHMVHEADIVNIKEFGVIKNRLELLRVDLQTLQAQLAVVVNQRNILNRNMPILRSTIEFNKKRLSGYGVVEQFPVTKPKKRTKQKAS
jgi:hypothetical protein